MTLIYGDCWTCGQRRYIEEENNSCRECNNLSPAELMETKKDYISLLTRGKCSDLEIVAK